MYNGHNSRERIKAAIERSGITRELIIERIHRNTGICLADAAKTLDRLDQSASRPIVVAAAVIELLAERNHA